MDYTQDLAAIAKNLLNPGNQEYTQPESSVRSSNDTQDDQVFSVLQGMINTAQDTTTNDGKRRQPSSHDLHTRSGRRVHSSHKRVKRDDFYNTQTCDWNLANTASTSNLLSSKLPSEDEEDEDYDVMTARSPQDIHGLLQQYQSFDDSIIDNAYRAPSEAATDVASYDLSDMHQPKKKGRKATEGTEDEKRERRLQQQRIAAARSRKNKKEELHKVEKDNEELRYLNKMANERIDALEKEVRESKLHIYNLENEKLAVKGQNGHRHPAVKQLIEAVQALVQATDGDGYEVLDKVDQEEAALTDDESSHSGA